jgi:hypothetical protein
MVCVNLAINDLFVSIYLVFSVIVLFKLAYVLYSPIIARLVYAFSTIASMSLGQIHADGYKHDPSHPNGIQLRKILY